VDITIYLPDDLARRAKESRVNLSRMLRDALTEHFQEEDAMAATLDDSQEIKLQLENEDGSVYYGRIKGKMIGAGDHNEVYLTEAENVVVYDTRALKYYIEDKASKVSLEDLNGDADLYLQVMAALGREATIDLDV
jgi:post-segregation antitoxin (ccd killing protein)